MLSIWDALGIIVIIVCFVWWTVLDVRRWFKKEYPWDHSTEAEWRKVHEEYHEGRKVRRP